MKNFIKYLILVISLFNIQTTIGQNFYKTHYDLDTNTQNQYLRIHSQKVSSYYWNRGSEFIFNTQITPETESIHPGDINIYIKLHFPNNKEKLYQLDYVRSENTKKSITYSCLLILTQEGSYQVEYYNKNLNGEIFIDPNIYEFKVLSE